jgi:hypothetical protein
MNTIQMTFDTQAVIDRMKVNLVEHQEIHAEAVQGYRDHAQNMLNQGLEELFAREGAVPININLVTPEDHSEDYKSMISMLEDSDDQTITFDQDQHRCFMLDNWIWQKSFLTTVSGYSTLAARKLGGV